MDGVSLTDGYFGLICSTFRWEQPNTEIVRSCITWNLQTYNLIQFIWKAKNKSVTIPGTKLEKVRCLPEFAKKAPDP